MKAEERRMKDEGKGEDKGKNEDEALGSVRSTGDSFYLIVNLQHPASLRLSPFICKVGTPDGVYIYNTW